MKKRNAAQGAAHGSGIKHSPTTIPTTSESDKSLRAQSRMDFHALAAVTKAASKKAVAGAKRRVADALLANDDLSRRELAIALVLVKWVDADCGYAFGQQRKLAEKTSTPRTTLQRVLTALEAKGLIAIDRISEKPGTTSGRGKSWHYVPCWKVFGIDLPTAEKAQKTDKKAHGEDSADHAKPPENKEKSPTLENANVPESGSIEPDNPPKSPPPSGADRIADDEKQSVGGGPIDSGACDDNRVDARQGKAQQSESSPSPQTSDPLIEAVRSYNAVMLDFSLPPYAPDRVIKDNQRKWHKQIAENYTLPRWHWAMAKVAELAGRGEWTKDFAWLMRGRNFQKILDGSPPTNPKPSRQPSGADVGRARLLASIHADKTAGLDDWLATGGPNPDALPAPQTIVVEGVAL